MKRFGFLRLWMSLSTTLFLINCSASSDMEKNMPSIDKTYFGQHPNGKTVFQYHLDNGTGIKMKVMTLGGVITSLSVPDRYGNAEDIVLGHDTLQAYLENSPYFGAIIGRFANRIAGGTFTLNGRQYQLATNDGSNHLHGGNRGFDKVIWNVREIHADSGVGIAFSYLSEDGDEGYPGNVGVEVTYFLGADSTLTIDYKATTDAETIINLTHHSYFNLTGSKEDILGHQLMINSNGFLPVDSTLIPTGKINNVQGTPFDFSELTAIGKYINSDHQQLKYGLGFDHCWVLSENSRNLKSPAAILFEQNSGRTIEIYTTCPGIQFYSGNFLDGSIIGKKGKVYKQRYGLCLETQYFPDSPNIPEFPTVVLKPGDVFASTTRFKFKVD